MLIIFVNYYFLKKSINILLYPISLLYGVSLYLRNLLFDWRILSSKEFDFPVISVGNLSVGGVGKTPHVEHLIRLLRKDFKVATLSRGYKRNTKGFYIANKKSTFLEIGDEPLQFYNKFHPIPVAVDEKRVRGIKQLKENNSSLNVILLDDAYQHRYVKPGINILVTNYSDLYINDYMLPFGRLREWKCGSNRADIIIVSKCPKMLSPIDRRGIKEDINPKTYQEIYFSYLEYGNLKPFTDSAKKMLNEFNKKSHVLLLTGIAKPQPLFNYVNKNFKSVVHLRFKDHHNFSNIDLTQIKNSFNQINENNKLIITTEKDIMRLSLPNIKEKIENLPIYYLPIEVKFHGDDEEEFNKQVIKYVRANSRN